MARRARTVLVGSLVLVAALIAPQAADAVTTKSVTVVSRGDSTAGWHTDSSDTFCPTLGSGLPDQIDFYEAGPAKPPLGDGSVVIPVPALDRTRLEQTLPSRPDQDLTAALTNTYAYPISDGDAAMTATVHIILDVNSTDFYDLSAPLPATTKTWKRLDVLGSDLTWSQGTVGSLTETNIGHGTYTQFVGANGSSHPATLDTFMIALLNCGTTTQTYAADAFTTGLDSGGTNTVTTVDFEPLATTITPKLSATSIVAGGRVTPSLTMKVSGTKLHEVKVTLSKRIAGTSSYRTVATELVNSQGVATGPVQRPTANTTYRWAYSAPAGNPFGSATAAITVHVAPKIAVIVPKHPVAAHKAVSVTGSASPKAKGTVVTLWQAKGKHHVKLAHGTEKSSGKFRLTKRLSAGTYHLYVTVAKSTTNSAGTSAKHTVTVR
jgi:hypothetical protein